MEIRKVDPPNWWARHTLGPVRLLIRGRGLRGARVSAPAPLSAGRAKVNAAGTSLFVDLKIPARAAPGSYPLEVRSPDGQAQAAFELLPPLPKKRALPSFGPDDIFYLIMPDRFAQGGAPWQEPVDAPGSLDRKKGRSYHGGNLQGILDHLDYLKDLGITALWLTPLYANTRRLHAPTSWSPDPFTDYHGYGSVDYYALDERLGDLATLRALVEAAHERRIKIVLDQVNNHTGPHHPWVDDPPTPTWFHGTPQRHRDNPFQTWVISDPYASRELQAPMMEGWFGGMLPDLNQDDPEMARYMIQNIVWWAGICGADGLRHDVAGLVPRSFWRDCFAALKRQFPDMRVLGEVNGDLPATIATYQAGRPFGGVDAGFDSLFDFPLRKAVRSVFLDGKSMEELPATLSQDRLYGDPSLLVTCLGLHDDSRFMGRPGASLPGLKLAFAFLLTIRGIPLLYYGDELALPGGEDPDNRRDFPGGWPGDPRSAFTRSGRSPEENDVFEHVKRLTALRARHAALRRGRLVNLAAGERFYAYGRISGRDWAVVSLNNGAEPRDFDFSLQPLGLRGPASLQDRLGKVPVRVEGGRIRFQLPPKTAAVYTA